MSGASARPFIAGEAIVAGWQVLGERNAKKAAWAVWCWLAQHADDAGACFPSARRICEAGRLTRSLVADGLEQLQQLGLIECTSVGARGNKSWRLARHAPAGVRRDRPETPASTGRESRPVNRPESPASPDQRPAGNSGHHRPGTPATTGREFAPQSVMESVMESPDSHVETVRPRTSAAGAPTPAGAGDANPPHGGGEPEAPADGEPFDAEVGLDLCRREPTFRELAAEQQGIVRHLVAHPGWMDRRRDGSAIAPLDRVYATVATVLNWASAGYAPAGYRALLAYTALLAEEADAAGVPFNRWAKLRSLVDGFTKGHWRPELRNRRRNELQELLLAGDLDGALQVHRRMAGYRGEERAKRDQAEVAAGLERLLAEVSAEPVFRELVEGSRVEPAPPAQEAGA